jgi:PASTA domain-containing protein
MRTCTCGDGRGTIVARAVYRGSEDDAPFRGSGGAASPGRGRLHGSPGTAVPVVEHPTSPSWSGIVVPDVMGENYLEAMVAVDPPFRLMDVSYRVSSDVPNGTILRQRPPAGTTFHSIEREIRIRVVVSMSSG